MRAYEGRPNYDAWVGLPALPKFNTANPQVRQFIFDVARYWLEQGIDGWRLDVPFEIKDDAFWHEFRRVVKSTNPEAYIVGEIPWEARQWLQGDQFDAAMNYQFTQACLGFFGGPAIDRATERGMMGLPPTQVLDAPAFDRRVHELLSIYPQEIALAQLNLLDSHDMPRFLSHDFFKSCIALRKTYPALRSGELLTLFAQDQRYAYMRRLGDETLIVALNNGSGPWQIDIPLGKFSFSGLQSNTLSGAGQAQIERNRLTGMTLPPRSGSVLGLD